MMHLIIFDILRIWNFVTFAISSPSRTSYTWGAQPSG
jgi:hypothetical protein